MFGLVNINSVLVTYPDKQAIMEKSASDGTSLVEGVGMFLFAFYHVVIIIVLVNMLIAMMSHSFEDIQVRLLCFQKYHSRHPGIFYYLTGLNNGRNICVLTGSYRSSSG